MVIIRFFFFKKKVEAEAVEEWILQVLGRM